MTSIFSEARSMTGLGRMARSISVRGAALGTAVLVAGCSDSLSVTGGPTPIDPLFRSYVALGNSITAGYQSGGISDSTQRESYARLFAMQVNTRYAYASFAGSGCPAPIDTFPSTRPDTTSCYLRRQETLTSRLNNVAVPGATSLDPISASTSASNPLTTFILGGKTQVEKAAEAEPTFISAWIGNNDVLAPALSGILVPFTGVSAGMTPVDTFIARYQTMLTQLRAIPTLKGGVLIGVVQVANAPVLVPSIAFLAPQTQLAINAATGRTVTVDPLCATAGALISLQILNEIRDGTHPPTIACHTAGEPAPVGNIFVLDASEQTALRTQINQYNAFISAKADSLGWAYYDPNHTLDSLKTAGCIPAVPNLASLTHTFGDCVSLDGVHPNGTAHRAIVDDMIAAVNAKYAKNIPLLMQPLQ
jgi:lysophospholipase L1-like esterase